MKAKGVLLPLCIADTLRSPKRRNPMKAKMVLVLLILTLVAGQVAYAQGYNVRRTAVVDVPQYANNAPVNDLTFYPTDSDEPDIAYAPPGETLTITIAYGLLITNDDSVRDQATAVLVDMFYCLDQGAGVSVECGGENPETNPSATLSNEGGTGVITITIPEGNRGVTLAPRNIRVDASALAPGDEIVATVTSTTDADTVGLGGPASQGGVSGVVGVVKAGLKVTADRDAALACSAKAAAPSITVAEGFSWAWGPERFLINGVGESPDRFTSVRIVLDNLPDDAKVEWPDSVDSTINLASSGEDEDLKVNGILTLNVAESSSNGRVVVYDFKTRLGGYHIDDPADTNPSDGTDQILIEFPEDLRGVPRSFKVTPSKITIMGDASANISAQLWPPARKGAEGQKLNLDSELSYEHPLLAPEKGNGEGWLVISKCVTYLLYPFVTCGATPGWSTAISVSNTTADADIFGAFDETNEQTGSVVLYGFPAGRMLSEVEDEEEEPTVEAVVDRVSDDLKAGDTMTFDCSNTMMAGTEGYAIIRAGFQHARGMAFVFGNFVDGAAVDVSHGYKAEVIDDPRTRSDDL